MQDQSNQLQQEWRAEVMQRFNELKHCISSLTSEISSMKMSYATRDDYERLRARIEELEKTKSLLWGSVIALNTVCAIIAWVSSKLHIL